MTRKPITDEVAREQLNAAALRFRRAQASLRKCRERTDLTNILDGKLVEAEGQWNKAAADYRGALSDYADALLADRRRASKRPLR
jgi:hypothetical protein